MSVQCRKCRNKVIEQVDSVFLDSHGERLGSNTNPICSVDSLYFIEENSVPWISAIIEQESWLKGKLNCPQCAARLGSFDFTSISKCPCGSNVQPAVHLVKSKVDCKIPRGNILPITSTLN